MGVHVTSGIGIVLKSEVHVKRYCQRVYIYTIAYIYTVKKHNLLATNISHRYHGSLVSSTSTMQKNTCTFIF